MLLSFSCILKALILIPLKSMESWIRIKMHHLHLFGVGTAWTRAPGRAPRWYSASETHLCGTIHHLLPSCFGGREGLGMIQAAGYCSSSKSASYFPSSAWPPTLASKWKGVIVGYQHPMLHLSFFAAVSIHNEGTALHSRPGHKIWVVLITESIKNVIWCSN